MKTMHMEPNLMLDSGVHVVEFYARWCGTCRAVIKHLTELEDEMGFSGVLVDVEQLPIVARSFRTRGVPVVVLIENGIELGRLSGSLTKQEIREWLLGFDVI